MVSALALAALLVQSPEYTASSVVNAATNRPHPVSPNSFISIYGRNLSWNTAWIRPGDIASGTLPTSLPGSGVRVFLGNIAVYPFFVSPTQINVLIPPRHAPGSRDLVVHRDGVVGPRVALSVESVSPALFQQGPYAVATDPDGTLLTPERPAAPGSIIILYASGLGSLRPPLLFGDIPREAAEIERRGEFRARIGGVEAEVLYAGVTPYSAGLYQINLRVPAAAEPDPEVRIGFPDAMSPEGVRLPVR
ncbi:MAG: hypothetical protein K2X35_00930 [Bryobacteraceae bacterium]|nr:hypothetical protein [Bryobacteraceae bacterium]